MKLATALLSVIIIAGCAQQRPYDFVIRHGTVYDGTGTPESWKTSHPRRPHCRDGRSAHGARSSGNRRHRARGIAWIYRHAQPLRNRIARRRALTGNDSPGVTLVVFGESSMGPLNDQMKKDMVERQGDIKFDVTWTTLGEFLDHLVKTGVSTNVASFVSAATVRINEVGYANRPPTADETRSHARARQTRHGRGAMGLTSALIYTPGVFARPTSSSNWRKSPRRPTACTSRTSAAKAIACSKRSTKS